MTSRQMVSSVPNYTSIPEVYFQLDRLFPNPHRNILAAPPPSPTFCVTLNMGRVYELTKEDAMAPIFLSISPVP